MKHFVDVENHPEGVAGNENQHHGDQQLCYLSVTSLIIMISIVNVWAECKTKMKNAIPCHCSDLSLKLSLNRKTRHERNMVAKCLDLVAEC